LIDLDQVERHDAFGIAIATPNARFDFSGGPEMQSILLWPALMVLAGAAVTAPAMGNANNRAILYWFVLPSLAVGVAAMFTRMGAF
jgi:hypothetical protein